MFAGILFDMDGTLVDSDAAVARSWRSWAAQAGVAPELLELVEHGVPAGGSIRVLRPDLDDEAVAAESARLMDMECDDLDDVVALPGALHLLAALDAAGVPWAVVTSAGRRLARVRLDAAGIEVPVLVTRDDVSRGKPDPESYLAGAAALGVDPADCLVVEDAEAGLAAGRAAGARTAALRGLDGDLRPSDLTELARMLDLSPRPVPGS